MFITLSWSEKKLAPQNLPLLRVYIMLNLVVSSGENYDLSGEFL